MVKYKVKLECMAGSTRIVRYMFCSDVLGNGYGKW